MRTVLVLTLLSLASLQLPAQTTEIGVSFTEMKATDQVSHLLTSEPCDLPQFNPNCRTVGERISQGTQFAWLFTYARHIVRAGPADLYVEAPFFVVPGHDIVDAAITTIPLPSPPLRVTTGVFITPSLKVKFLSSKLVSPFASVGGGWAHFGGSGSNGNNFGITTKDFNSGALQFGGGVDFRVVRFLALRAEIRDVYTGTWLSLDKGRSVVDQKPHNIFLGGGIVFRK